VDPRKWREDYVKAEKKVVLQASEERVDKIEISTRGAKGGRSEDLGKKVKSRNKGDYKGPFHGGERTFFRK